MFLEPVAAQNIFVTSLAQRSAGVTDLAAETREKAKAALGPAFSLPAFHDVVLRTGTVPLDLWSDVVDDWIATQVNAKPAGR